MKLDLPSLTPADCTPVVVRLVEIIQQLQERIVHLEAEVAQLKGLPPRPKLAPSPLERPAPSSPDAQRGTRPGSDKRPKTAQLTIHREVVVALAEVPPGSTFQGYADFVVQELVLRAEVTRYRRQCWRSPDGRTLVAPLPADLEGRHFGPKLRA